MPDIRTIDLPLPSMATAAKEPVLRASLTLGHVLKGIGGDNIPAVELTDMHVIRHSFKPSDPDALRGPEDLTPERVLAYTREQDVPPRFPANPPRYWVILIADGGRRSRLWGTFENHGEVTTSSSKDYRCFDLRPSQLLAPLKDRLVVEWDNPRSWHRNAGSLTGSRMPVLEIADRDKVHFPGFDGVLLTTTNCATWWTIHDMPTGVSHCQKFKEFT